MGRFCADDHRLLAGGYVPLSLGPEVAGELLDEAFADGCFTVMVDTNEADPEARSFTHPDFDPVWARFAARRAGHLAHRRERPLRPGVPSFKNNGRGATAVGGDAPDSNLGLVAMNNSVELFLSAMILDEVFERHDGLRVLSLEHGASWVPGWLHKLDFVERTTRRVTARSPGVGRGAERIRFAPFAGEPVGWIMEQLGPEMLCFASDYPHPEGSRDPIGKFEATMEDVSQADLGAFSPARSRRSLVRA